MEIERPWLIFLVSSCQNHAKRSGNIINELWDDFWCVSAAIVPTTPSDGRDRADSPPVPAGSSISFNLIVIDIVTVIDTMTKKIKTPKSEVSEKWKITRIGPIAKKLERFEVVSQSSWIFESTILFDFLIFYSIMLCHSTVSDSILWRCSKQSRN